MFVVLVDGKFPYRWRVPFGGIPLKILFDSDEGQFAVFILRPLT